MSIADDQETLTRGPVWDDDLWEALLRLIDKQQVIPVIGPALSTVDVGGRRMTVEEYVAEQLCERLAFGPNDISGQPTLDKVICAHLGRRNRLDDLYPKINAILAGQQFEPPEALVKLASIGQFKLIVTTAFDSLMEAALDKVRGGGQQVTDSIGYVPSEMPNCDISRELRQLTSPTVYHLLGKVSALPEYVISDDDLLEYVFALSSDKQPLKLFDELENNFLLILGGNFSDWLLRLILRLAKRQRLSDRRRPPGDREILADERSRHDQGLISFLANFSPQTKLFDAGAGEFIDELHRRCVGRYGAYQPASATAQRERHGIFISYARQDVAAARALREGLEAEKFVVWLDEREMRGGEDFDYKIATEIHSCAVFLPLISRNTEQDTHDAYFRREWSLAEERDRGNAARVQFILPLVVDDTPIDQLEEVPIRFLRKHVLSAPGGAATRELVESLRSALGQRG